MWRVSYSPILGSFQADLSYCLRLLIDFDTVEVDRSGRLPAMGGVGPSVIVEDHPSTDGRLCLGSCVPGVQVDAFILQGSPEGLMKTLSIQRPFAVHGDPGANALQPISPGEGREL